jgi:hypothetical protein
MCKIFEEHGADIERYCRNNKLSADRVFVSPISFNNDFVAVLYADPDKGKLGLLDETPADVLLWIKKIGDNIIFEQTEHTMKHLAI